MAEGDDARTLLALGADLHAKDNEGHEPLHLCIRRHPYGRELSAKTVDTLQALVAFGATWDTKCDELVSGGEASEEARALCICVLLWMEDIADSLPFTRVPPEVIRRGADSTQSYIDDWRPVFRRKISLVGSSCAGKTSLVKSIISQQPHFEHVDERTIGIDHFPLRFSESSATSDGKRKIHEVTFWDFAGQDAYQAAHSLFFSRRTLYLVCVDLQAFAIAYMQAAIFADHDFQETVLLDEFVEDSVMRWVRLIVARQPDAEFVFIATKEDVLADNKVTEELLKECLLAKLKQVNRTVQQMMEPEEKDTRLADDNSMDLMGWWNKGTTAVQWMAYQLMRENQKKPTHLSNGRAGDAMTVPTVVFVSCTSLMSIQDARTKIKDLVVESDYSFEMPGTYTRVLNEIVKIREATKTKGIATRISEVFVRMDSLPDKLGVEPELCRTILQTLHDLGDVLWYEDLDVPLFWNTVILDPLLLIDFIREVFNHKTMGQILPHYELKAKDYWVALDYNQMEAMKQVLQAFDLVYSDDEYRVMEWNSDLFVPALWQTKTSAALKFFGGILRINTTRSLEGEAMRVHWEFHFESGFPSPLFTDLVIASVSPYYGCFAFDAGPDWIMYKEEGVAACRIMVSRDPKSLHRTIHVEAVVSETASPEQGEYLWWSFKQLCEAFVKVLRKNPGLKVSSFAWTDKAVKINMDDLLWSTRMRPLGKWMPPDETWGWFKCLVTGQDRTQTIEADWDGI